MEIRSTVGMFPSQFHPLVIVADRDDKHHDVLQVLTDLLTGHEVKGGELYLLSALTDMNRLIP